MALPGKRLPVSSWNERIEVLHARNIVRRHPTEGDHLRSHYYSMAW